LIAALTSGFVGAIALGTSVYNVYLQRQQVSAAVWPNLEWTMNPGDNGLSFGVANRGTGPAIVKTFVVWVDDKKMHTWGEALHTLLRTDDWDIDGMTDLMRTVSPGGDATALLIKDHASILHTAKERRRLAFDVCYCSTLDDCWNLHVAAARNATTTAVKRCLPETDRFTALNERQLDFWLSTQMDDAGVPLPAERTDAH
jgi:hypothetical protein